MHVILQGNLSDYSLTATDAIPKMLTIKEPRHILRFRTVDGAKRPTIPTYTTITGIQQQTAEWQNALHSAQGI